MSRKAKETVTLDEVDRLARLSRLTMTSQEEEKLRDELSTILDYFRVVDGVSGTASPHGLVQSASSLRMDEVGRSDPDGVLSGVPRKKGRLVRAPRVF